MKKTKIICTMGPNTNDRELIKQLALNGMDIARFNFLMVIMMNSPDVALVESVRQELNIPIATYLIQRDLKSEQVTFENGKVHVFSGQTFTLVGGEKSLVTKTV